MSQAKREAVGIHSPSSEVSGSDVSPDVLESDGVAGLGDGSTGVVDELPSSFGVSVPPCEGDSDSVEADGSGTVVVVPRL